MVRGSEAAGGCGLQVDLRPCDPGMMAFSLGLIDILMH